MSDNNNEQKENYKNSTQQSKTQQGFIKKLNICCLYSHGIDNDKYLMSKIMNPITEKNKYFDPSSMMGEDLQKKPSINKHKSGEVETDTTLNQQIEKIPQIVEEKNETQNKHKYIQNSKDCTIIYQTEMQSCGDNTYINKNNFIQSDMDKLKSPPSSIESRYSSHFSLNTSKSSFRKKNSKSIEMLIKSKYNQEDDWIKHLSNVTFDKDTEVFDGKKLEFYFKTEKNAYRLYSIKVKLSDQDTPKISKEFEQLRDNKQKEKDEKSNIDIKMTICEDIHYQIYYFIIQEM